jgi:transposase
MEVLWLRSQIESSETIAASTNLTAATVRKYIHLYLDGGVDALKLVNWVGPKSTLEEHHSTIEEELRQRPPATLAEASERIFKITGIRRSRERVRQYLHKIGMKPRKVAAIPAKADIAKQEEFKTKQLEPRLEEARVGKRSVFFVDAAHFVHSAFLGVLWCFVRMFIRSPSGRNRFSVLGAWEVATQTLHTVTTDAYVTATTVVALLLQLRASTHLPITVVMDNARYQHCRLVMTTAATLEIELLFLPPYSPNLNLIERLWKFTKRKVLYNKYYENYDAFKTAIRSCLAKVPFEYRQELTSWMAPSFQTFSNQNILT